MKSADRSVIDISDDVKWIGVRDPDIVTFDIVMTTEFGTTYNSYFINAQKKTIIEASKEKFSDVHIEKLRSVTDPSQLSYIVLDHTEPDHCGNVGRLLEIAPDAVVVGSGNAIRYLSDMLNRPFRSQAVKDGDTLDLGNRKLRFISAPNLHWPDTMFTWLEEDRLLFTCDFFGAHYCFGDIFSDFSDDYLKSFKYYFDVILRPYSRFALKAIEKISSLDIDCICTGHGPVHRKNWKEVVELTREYSQKYLQLTSVKEIRNVLVAYVSAYGFTRQMAEEISAGLSSNPSIKVTLRDIESIQLGELESEVVAADALMVGSPTINQNTLLPVYRLFSVINPLRDNAKPAASFGSYGWSGEAPKLISETLRNLKLKIFADPAAFKFFPEGEKKDALREYGRRFAEFVIAECEAV